MSNHGHVIPNADGSRARCGGPAICTQCAKELAGINMQSAYEKLEAENRHLKAKLAEAEKENEELRRDVERYRNAAWDDSANEFLSKRLERVARLVNVPMPDGMSHQEIAQCAGTTLGQIAYKLEQYRKAVPEDVMKAADRYAHVYNYVDGAEMPKARKALETLIGSLIEKSREKVEDHFMAGRIYQDKNPNASLTENLLAVQEYAEKIIGGNVE